MIFTKFKTLEDNKIIRLSKKWKNNPRQTCQPLFEETHARANLASEHPKEKLLPHESGSSEQ